MNNKFGGLKLNRGILVGAIFTIFFITILIISSEINLYFKKILSEYFFNYWIAKGVLSASVFVVSAIVFKNTNYFRKNEDETYFLNYLSFFSTLCFLIVFVFFFFSK